MTYHVQWEPRGVHARVTGTLGEGDLVGLVNAICEDPRFDALTYCIVDTSGVESFAVDPGIVMTSAASLIGAAFTNGRVVVAVVSTHAASHAICGQLIELEAMPFPPAVFPDAATARRWIEAEVPHRRSLPITPDASLYRDR